MTSSTGAQKMKMQEVSRLSDKADVRAFMREVAEGWIDVQIGTSIYTVAQRLTSRQLAKGQIILAGYAKYNAGVDVVEVLGFTATDPAYGKDGIVSFDSVADVMADEGVKSVKALEIKQDENEYGHQSYMVVRDLAHRDSRYADSGPWYYLCEGRWSRGSGAEPLSFIQMVKFGNVCPNCNHINLLADESPDCEVCGTPMA